MTTGSRPKLSRSKIPCLSFFLLSCYTSFFFSFFALHEVELNYKTISLYIVSFNKSLENRFDDLTVRALLLLLLSFFAPVALTFMNYLFRWNYYTMFYSIYGVARLIMQLTLVLQNILLEVVYFVFFFFYYFFSKKFYNLKLWLVCI